jgi:hypothetical protein
VPRTSVLPQASLCKPTGILSVDASGAMGVLLPERGDTAQPLELCSVEDEDVAFGAAAVPVVLRPHHPALSALHAASAPLYPAPYVLTRPLLELSLGPRADLHRARQVGALAPVLKAAATARWSIASHIQGRPMLSAVTISVDSRMLGAGFFGLARDLGKLQDSSAHDERRFWDAEKAAVYETWQRDLRAGG